MCVRWACVVGVPGFVQSMHADGGLLPPPRLRSPLLLFFFLLFVRRRESLSLEEERLRLRLAILALRRQNHLIPCACSCLWRECGFERLAV